ncbi:GTPase-associated protein 1-related protein [Streptomyces sp. SJL17-4]|uniref:GTPase-associated protein 1-related protein n=1 Tax=Streptomyces sp. SJL17-4 TaxID=2967224 RepID=UPI0030D42502
MSLPQMHYTSAPPGPDGSGFRFTAVTPGVPSSVLREAEQLVGYEPPRDAPSRPTPSELALFPEMFSYTRLSDGSGLLSRTVYTGADYSGRWGNFHAHAVHLTAGDRLPGDLPPIAAWGAPQWADHSPEDGTPPPLDAFTPAHSAGLRAELAAFAAARQPRLAAVLADLRRLAESPHAPQIVLAEQDTRRVAHWVMLVNAALPHEFARGLTFTTYTRRPQQARQQIIGVHPEDVRSVAGQPHRYSVHDCSDPSAAPPPVADAWAHTAAAVWAADAYELIRQAAQTDGAEPFASGPLAALALARGIPATEDARTDAVAWVRAHPGALDETTLTRFLRAVCEVGPGAPELPSDTLADLLGALYGRVPVALTAPLTARLVSRAVRGGTTALPPLPPGALPEPYRGELAAESGDELRRTLRDPLTPLSRTVELLRVARLLGVAHDDLTAGLAERFRDGLLSRPGPSTAEALRETLAESGALRDEVSVLLDSRASDDPPGVARALRDTGLPVDGPPGALPHLRMCAAAPALRPEGTASAGQAGQRAADGAGVRPADGAAVRERERQQAWVRDRNGELHKLLRIAGVSHLENPLVLRTAFALVWDDRVPTAAEASQLLNETGARLLIAAETWDQVVAAAVDAPVDDKEAPALARQLLAAAPDAVGRSILDDLRLLSLVHDMEERKGDADPAQGGWTARVRALAGSARPNVRNRATAALARRLMGPDRPEGELGELARSDDGDLIDAYASAARTPVFRNVLRATPGRVADCFLAWTAHAGASPRWDLTRRALLDEVLRPVVQDFTDGEVFSVEQALGRLSASRAAAFQEWNRPSGGLGRLFRRRGRKPTTPTTPWRGDVTPPEGKQGR